MQIMRNHLFAAGALLLTPGLALAASACEIEQITNTEPFETSFLIRPDISGNGEFLSFTLRSDPLGNNGDHNWEMFRYSAELGLTQLTETMLETENLEAVQDRFGNRLSLETAAELVEGGNPEANVELYLWDADAGFSQITATTSGALLDSQLTRDGRRIVFTHSGDVLPQGSDGSELYRWSNGLLEQLTDAPGDHMGPICANDDATIVAFGSTANLVGNGNTDGNGELFVWSEGEGLAQWTDTQFGDVTHCHVSRDGARVAVRADQDLTGENPDRLTQLFVLDEPGNATQITTGTTSPARYFGADGTLRRIAFSSTADLVFGFNPDGSEEVFLWEEGQAIVQITDLPAQSNTGDFISVSEDGTRIAFSGTGDVTGGNPDGSGEVFVATCPNSDAFAMNAGHSAVWTPYDGERLVQSSGIFVELVPDANIALPQNVFAGAWFAHDESSVTRFAGETNRWMTLQGSWSDGSDTADFTIYQVLDGVFDGSTPGATVAIGEGQLRVLSCTEAEFAFTLYNYALADQWRLERTFNGNDEFCQTLQ